MNHPKALGFSYSLINAIAENFAASHEMITGNSLSKLVTSVGGKLYRAVDGENEVPDGTSIVVSKGKPLIKFDICTGPRRNEFDIAHNLGHFVLHYQYRKIVLGEHKLELVAPRYGTDNADREANCFARALIMPEAAFKKEFEKGNGDPRHLCMVFNTWAAQIVVRARELQLDIQARH